MHRVVLAVCSAAFAISGCGGEDSATKPPGTSARTDAETVIREEDQRRAEEVSLTSSDLGAEWDTSPRDPIVEDELSCLRFDDAGLVITAEAPGEVFAAGPPISLTAGKVFNRGSAVAFSSVRIYETEKQAHTAFNRMVGSLQTRALWGCLRFADQVPKGPRMVRLDSYYAPADKFPRITEQTWRHQYRIRIEKRGGTVFIDLVLMREERAVGVAFFSSVELPQLIAPISDEFVERMAQIMGKRLAP